MNLDSLMEVGHFSEEERLLAASPTFRPRPINLLRVRIVLLAKAPSTRIDHGPRDDIGPP